MTHMAVWFAIVAVLLGASSPAAARSAAAGLKGDPARFFTADDYPPEAVRLSQEGRVVVKLWVDVTGKVVSCTLTQSSGSPALDRRTCEIALAKLVYEPARDTKGRPIAAQTVLPVRWVLPRGPIDVAKVPPRWSMDMTFSVDSAGVILACNAKLTPTGAQGFDPCEAFPVGKETEFHWMRNGRPVGGTITRHAGEEIAIDP